MWSLLFVAANEGCQSAFQALIEYDKEHTQVLVGGGMDVKSDNNSTKVACGTDLQHLEQLLLTCVTASEVQLITTLIEEAPAVAPLGEPTVPQVCCVSQCHSPDSACIALPSFVRAQTAHLPSSVLICFPGAPISNLFATIPRMLQQIRFHHIDLDLSTVQAEVAVVKAAAASSVFVSWWLYHRVRQLHLPLCR